MINGSEVTCVSSAVPSLSVRLPFWCRRPRPLHRGGSKVGSEETGAGLRVAHDAFLTGLQTTGDNLQLCGWRQGTGEGTQVWFHTLTCVRWNGDGGSWAAFASEWFWKRWILSPHMRFTSCRRRENYWGRPVIRCGLISAGFLPLSQRVMTDGSFRSVSVFQYAKLNWTILNLVSNELGDPRGYGRPNGWKVWTGVSLYLRAGTNFCNLIWRKSPVRRPKMTLHLDKHEQWGSRV